MTSFRFHSEPLRRDWLDDYGHLNEAYYLVPFSNASWKLQEHFGIGAAYFRASGCALYTVETHLRYLREVRAPATLDIETRVLGADAKRMHFAHLMTAGGELRATAEFMALHYDTRARCGAPLPARALEMLREAAAELPPWAGRRVSFARD